MFQHGSGGFQSPPTVIEEKFSQLLNFPTQTKLFNGINRQFVMMGSRVRVTRAAPLQFLPTLET